MAWEATGNVRHDGRRYGAGAVVPVEGDQAEALKRVGAIVWTGKEPAIEVASTAAVQADPFGPPAPPAPADRTAAISAAVAQLGDDDWTQAGTPKVSAVERVTGLRDVTADELTELKRPD